MPKTAEHSAIWRFWRRIADALGSSGRDSSEKRQAVEEPLGFRRDLARNPTTRQRLVEKMAGIERLETERKRRNDPSFGKSFENRIVWAELIDLELQEVDEQVSRIDSGRPCAKEVVMKDTLREPLHLSSEELAVLAELLESERAKLLVEIRHTDHRAFRDSLRERLTLVEHLAERCRPS